MSMLTAETCLEAIECTASGMGNYTGCLPEDIAEYRVFFIVNSLLVITIGSFGNLLTLLALPYVRIRCVIKFTYTPRYGAQYPWLRSTTSTLILHLSLCDFLYCTTGLPVFVSIFFSGHFR